MWRWAAAHNKRGEAKRILSLYITEKSFGRECVRTCLNLADQDPLKKFFSILSEGHCYLGGGNADIDCPWYYL